MPQIPLVSYDLRTAFGLSSRSEFSYNRLLPPTETIVSRVKPEHSLSVRSC